MRRLKKIDVNFISLVDKGANRKKLVFKRCSPAEEAFEKSIEIKKLDDEQRIIFCIVYSPDEIDTQGDSASAEVIKDAAYNFMRCARTNNVDKQHDFIPDEGFVAESWIVKEKDAVFQEEPAGSWAVGIKVENDETWNLIKDGEITGISLAGLAITEELEKESGAADTGSGGAPPLNSVYEEMECRISLLEEESKNLSQRISKIENPPPASRQVKREEAAERNSIRIWT